MKLNKREIASTIRKNEEARREEQKKMKELREEYLAEKVKDKQPSSAMDYLPNLLVGLLFLSFPLAEQQIDWVVVGLAGLLNFLPIILFDSPSSWFNLIQVLMLNILYLQYTPFLYDIPAMVMSIKRLYLSIFLGGNTLLGLGLYLFYVGRKRSKKQHTRKNKKEDSLEEELILFKEEVERRSRMDNAMCAVLLINLVALVSSGAVHYSVVLQALRNLRHFML